MAPFFGTLAWQLYSSTPASVGGTLKRKRAGDDHGLLPTSNSYSEIAKRQRYRFHHDETTDTDSGEQSSRHRSLDPYDHQPAQCPSVSAEVAPSETLKKSRTDTISVSDRKRHFIYTPGDDMKGMMRKYVHDLYRLFDDSHEENNCWLHPSPPPARKNGRPVGTIQCNFAWKDSSGKHSLHVNFGMVALIVKHQLTEKQMEGYVNDSWHLSHLCGNWTCCNWRHMTIESARDNLSRNQCFPKAGHCLHNPPCMKDRKRQLQVTLAISTQIRRAVESTRDGAELAVERHDCSMPHAGYGCSICGEDVYCFGDNRICRSLASITKSSQALGKLELYHSQSETTANAIAHLKRIIMDLIREKEASDAVMLQSAVARFEPARRAHWSKKPFSSYGQRLNLLLD